MASSTAMLLRGSKLHARSTADRSILPRSHRAPKAPTYHHALNAPLMARRSVAVPSSPRGGETDTGVSASRRGLLVDGMASIAAMNGALAAAGTDDDE